MRNGVLNFRGQGGNALQRAVLVASLGLAVTTSGLVSCSKATSVESLSSTVAVPNPPTDGTIPTDPSVRMGVLDNGLRWYVEQNARPQDRATLRLVVKVGSVVEDDDQQGLAHFLEHMAFNGTENFQGNALIDYMESIGMEFGAHLNAYTSFDETVYLLTVPTDKPELLDTGLAVLRDQAGNMLLTEEEIERERGVVLEEWRLSLGAGDRIQRQMWANAFPNSRYSARFPIGTEDSLKGFSTDALRRFYTDWYRPELMAVIAVGDFDAERVQGQIEALFSSLENPAEPRPREVVDVPPSAESKVFVVTDKEATNAFAVIDDQYDGVEGSTWKDYRSQHIVPILLQYVANERLADVFREPDSPMVSAQLGEGRINAKEVETSFIIGVRGDRTLEAITTAVVEVERLRRHGITEGELQRAKAFVASQFEEYEKTAATTDSTTHAEELQRVFLEGEGMPGIPLEVAMVDTWLPDITRDEVNQQAATLLQRGSRVVQVVVPERDGFTVPDVESVRAALQIPADADLSPPEDTQNNEPLVANPPPVDGGKVVERSGPDALGITTLTLGNGVTVLVKPTDFADDEVLLTARSAGGISLVDDTRFNSARSTTGVLAESGLGSFDSVDLGKRMAGVRAELGAGVSGTGEWMSGGSSKAEVETMLQLAWLYFTAPRFTAEGEKRAKAMLREALASRDRAPEKPFQDAWQEALVGHGLRQDPLTLADVKALDHTVAESVWQERFADPTDFHWIVVGDVELDTLEPLLARWLGQLPVPSNAEAESVDHTRISGPLPGRREIRVEEGRTPRAQVRVMWHGPMESTWLTRNRVMALSDIVSGRLRTVLREDLGGVYGVSLSGGIADYPEPHFQVVLSFACDPERVDELLSAAQDQFDAVMQSGVTDEEIAVEQEQNRRDREERIRTNGFWTEAVVGALARGDDPADLLTWDERNESLSSDELKALANTVWGPDAHRLQAVWVPKAAE